MMTVVNVAGNSIRLDGDNEPPDATTSTTTTPPTSTEATSEKRLNGKTSKALGNEEEEDEGEGE